MLSESFMFCMHAPITYTTSSLPAKELPTACLRSSSLARAYRTSSLAIRLLRQYIGRTSATGGRDAAQQGRNALHPHDGRDQGAAARGRRARAAFGCVDGRDSGPQLRQGPSAHPRLQETRSRQAAQRTQDCMSQANLSNLIWSVADLLRGDYKQSDYGKVILPFTVLRRLDCVLEATKEAVLKEHKAKLGRASGGARVCQYV